MTNAMLLINGAIYVFLNPFSSPILDTLSCLSLLPEWTRAAHAVHSFALLQQMCLKKPLICRQDLLQTLLTEFCGAPGKHQRQCNMDRKTSEVFLNRLACIYTSLVIALCLRFRIGV